MWHNFCLLLPMLTFAKGHLGDFAKTGAVEVQRTNMAPVHVLWAVVEVGGALRVARRASIASISVLALMKACSAASLVLGMLWSPTLCQRP